MSEILVESTRGNIVECIHRGDIVVTDSSGKILYSVGDPHKITYMRSATKPLQAINVFLSGAHDHFQFSDQEIAIMCSSHYAEPYHLKTISAILNKIGLEQKHILGGIVTSLNPEYALKLAWDNVILNSLFSDCSGKHSGMLAVCVHKGYSLDDYLTPQHPCQKDILNIIAEMADINSDDLVIGIDGCSAPVHALPLKNMALSFAKLANPQQLNSEYRQACGSIFKAVNAYPEMISGTDGFCSELIKQTNGKLIGKIGAQGVYCLGIKDKNLGIAVKIEDGSMKVIPSVVISLLEQLKLLRELELKALDKYRIMNNLNDINTVVGQIKPVFSLTNQE